MRSGRIHSCSLRSRSQGKPARTLSLSWFCCPGVALCPASFDVEQIPTYDSSSGEDERAGAALEKWAAYRGLSRGASESSEEREAEGQGDVEGEREVGYDLGFEEDSPAGMLPPDSEGPSDASGLPRKRRRAASGQARDGAGPQGEHSEAATDEAAVAAEDALFLDEWEELEDAPEEDPAQEGKGEGAVALASVAAMMDRKRRSSRRQESTGDSSERGRERTRKAASALRKGREEKPSAAKPEEGTSWLNRTHTDSVQRLIRGLVRPPLEPTVRDSLLSRVVSSWASSSPLALRKLPLILVIWSHRVIPMKVSLRKEMVE